MSFFRFYLCAALLVGLFLFSTLDAQAKITVSKLFSNGAVLQRDRDIPVWGFGDRNEKVVVTFADQKPKSAVVDANGRWKVILDAMPAGGPYVLTIAGTNTITVKDVLVGEVWLCAGQSNMLFPVWKSEGGKSEIAAANFPKIRMFQVQKQFARKPMADTDGSWIPCESKNVATMSAVAYYYAKELQETLKIPIGILDCSVGGTPINAWISKRSLMGIREYPSMIGTWETLTLNEPISQKYKTTLFDIKNAETNANKIEVDLPSPDLTLSVPHLGSPTALFNGMIAPIIPYGIRGFVWYQGEADVFNVSTYRILFAALIDDWRTRFTLKNEVLPFLFVQLPNYGAFSQNSWSSLRDAQRSALEMPYSYMATAVDLGHEVDIHPTQKKEVGHRLALQALGNVYKQKVETSGPTYESMTVFGPELRLRFSHSDGLHAKAQDGKIKGFEVSGFNGKFLPAEAKIEGSEISLTNVLVKKPAEVRYGWGDMTDCNLYNGSDLPTAPFRIQVTPQGQGY